MTSEQFDQLVNRIQQKYSVRPLALRMRIALLVGLGYAGFLAVLLIVLMLAAALAVAALVADSEPSIFLMALVAILLAFGLWQALVFLWVPMQPEKARDVSRDEAPRLFQLLDTLQTDLHVTPFDHVQITPDFNAGVLLLPRLGVFGFNRKYLKLGLPLMLVLSPDQFAAVLAHEFAHCSSRHDRFGRWIYRLRLTWLRVFAELREPLPPGCISSLRTLVLRFVDWYWPRFNAHAFVLSRANEYEADRLADAYAGSTLMAEALVRIECFSRRLYDQFWSDMTQLAKSDSDVPDNILERIETFLGSDPEPADAARWLEQSARALTDNVDTHPSLSDRLRSLGCDVTQFTQDGFPQLPELSAANDFLGAAFSTITDDMNRHWQQENRLQWQNVFHLARRLEKQLEPTMTTASATTADTTSDADEFDAGEFDVDQLWQQARTVCDLQGTAVGEPLLRKLLDRRPTHALANMKLGLHLLDRGQHEGEKFLLQVLKDDDSDLIPAVCQGLITYFQQQGHSEKVQVVRSQLSRYQIAQAGAAKERSIVTHADMFVPHGLSDLELAALYDTLAQQADLASAWLVRKELQHFRKQKLFVLVAHSQPFGVLGSTDATRDRTLVAQLIPQVQLPGRVLIVAPQGGFRPLARKIMSQHGSQVFPTLRRS